MNYEELKKHFESQNIDGWQIDVTSNRKYKLSGQASVLHVCSTNGDYGMYRVLKRKDKASIERFRREVLIITSEDYKHKNLMEILKFSEEGLWYISRRGESFFDFWNKFRTESNLSPNEVVFKAIEIIDQLCDGLEKLHEAGVVHRDIKPDNIIVINNAPILIDFGLVYLPKVKRVSKKGEAVGNMRFSPDQAMNYRLKVPPWLDVFQLAQLFIWMINKRPAKRWPRPLNWKWVIYPKGIEALLELKIRAVTALCSDEITCPKNAGIFKTLLVNYFKPFDNVGITSTQNTNINYEIEVAETEHVLSEINKINIFQSTFPAINLILVNLFSGLKRLETKNGNYQIKIIDLMMHSDLGTEIITKFKSERHVKLVPFKAECSTNQKKTFWIEVGFVFWDMEVLNNKNEERKLPEHFYPYYLFLYVQPPELMYTATGTKKIILALDEEGEIWKSNDEGAFSNLNRNINNNNDHTFLELASKSGVKTASIEEIITEVEMWINDKEIWKAIIKRTQ